MISPQELGSQRDEVTLTLMGEEIPAVLAAIDLFPSVAACFTDDPECGGVNSVTPDEVLQQCMVCAEMTGIGLLLGNVRVEVTRRWQPTATQLNAE